MFNLIENMYENVHASVKVENFRTDMFQWRSAGVLSPEMFILFINILNTEIAASETHGIFVCEVIGAMKLLLFADAAVLVSRVQ